MDFAVARTSLNVKVKGQGHQGQISSPLQMHCNTLAANNVHQRQMGPLRRCQGVIIVHKQCGQGVLYVAACVRFMFGKTSVASSYGCPMEEGRPLYFHPIVCSISFLFFIA